MGLAVAGFAAAGGGRRAAAAGMCREAHRCVATVGKLDECKAARLLRVEMFRDVNISDLSEPAFCAFICVEIKYRVQ